MKTQSKLERIDVRISAEIKSLFSRAAEVSGTTLSAFIIEAARERAARLIEQHDHLSLNNQARDMLLNALTHPPAPNEALRRAAEKYKK